VKGYAKLSELSKQIFEKVYKKHNASQGAEYKKNWVPTKAIDRKGYIEVYFKNKEWLHYLPNGTWY